MKPPELLDLRVSGLLELMERLARGDLDARGEVIGNGDPLDAVMEGLNMLAEEFEAQRGDSRRAEREAWERARLEGVLLAARTMQHELNNRLALTVGYADVIAGDPRLPADLQEPAREALRGALESAEMLTRLGATMRLEERDQGAPGGTVLDVERSTAAVPPWQRE